MIKKEQALFGSQKKETPPSTNENPTPGIIPAGGHTYTHRDLLYSALYQISEAAHSEQSLDDLYHSIHTIVSRLMPARNLYIAHYDAETDTVSFPYWVDEYDSRPRSRQGGRGKTEYVLRTGKPFLEEGEKFNGLLKKGEYERLGNISVDWLGVPLRAGGKVIGILAVQSYDQGVRYGQEELDILEFVSDQVAMAIERKRTEMALLESRKQLILVTDSLPLLIAHLSAEHRYLYVNRTYAEWYGLSKEGVVGKSINEVLDANAVAQIMPNIELALKGEQSTVEHVLTNKDGKERIVSSTYIPQPGENGEIKAYFLTIEDINERKRGEQALLESEERYALAVRGANDGIWDWDLRNNTIYFSPRWKRILGYADDEIGNKPDEWFSRIHPSEKLKVQEEINSYLNGKSPHLEIEHNIMHKDGKYRWVLVRGLSIRDPLEQAHRMAGSMSDITAKKGIEERLRHDAMHDPLTNLPNRAYFIDQLRRSLERSKRNRKHLAAVLFMDLDRFKIVNDSLGHGAGDKMLIEISRRLQTCVRPSDTIARFGGDEFAILLDTIHALSEAIHIADRIQQKLQDPFKLYGHEVFTSASIGIVLTHESSGNVEDLLRDADAAMYRAKTSGRNRYEIFDANMHAQSLAVLQMESDLRRAIENGEFRLLYHPILTLADNQITSIEALLRWEHPQRGTILPEEFLPLAEETGLIVPIGYWVMEQACARLKAWQDAGFGQVNLTLNITGRQLQDFNVVKTITRILNKQGIKPGSLQLEVREDVLLPDADLTIPTLLELNGLGINISMDDFGTNYSSLNYLKRFPVNTIKIDSSFIHEIAAGEENEIITAMIAMAHILHLNVIAEGVETRDQLDFLIDKGCDQAQGYLFCKLLKGEELNELLKNGVKI